MKKLTLIIGLVAFLGMYMIPNYTSASTIAKVVVDKEKCEKCGKDDCKGNCEAKAGCNHKEAEAKKCAGKEGSASCAKKCGSAESHKCGHGAGEKAPAHKTTEEAPKK